MFPLDGSSHYTKKIYINEKIQNTLNTITHITKTHIFQNPNIHTPPHQSCQFSLTKSWWTQSQKSGTVRKFDLSCLEDENNSNNGIKIAVFYHCRSCENEWWKYLTLLIRHMLHLISLLHFFTYYLFFTRIENFVLYNLHICCYWLYIF